jgi:hypothetical protein
MLFGELRMGLRANPEEVRKSLDEEEDVEKEDEEMDKGSGSEESGSGEADESMEM